MQQQGSLKQWLVTWLFSAVGVVFAAATSGGISYGSSWGTLLVAALMLSILSAVLRPILVLLALPFVVLTLGLGLWIINALLFLLASALIDGFEVASFWSALWGAACVSIASFFARRFTGEGRGSVRVNIHKSQPKETPEQARPVRKPLRDDDVIDI